jgi:putative ABC transport system ATP-binding protein
MYELRNVTKTYSCRDGDPVDALAQIDLSIEQGDFVAIVGTSGSGKTTLLSVLGGMLAPTSGQVLLNGESVYDLPPLQRTKLRLKTLGFVFQSFNLIPWLTAIENVRMPMELGGLGDREQQQRAEELLGRVGLVDRLHHRPSELSQGQQQRVALARTLANEPSVILADEPTGNLDPQSRSQVMDYLAEFQADGRTVIMVTHDKFAAEYAQRTLQIESGRVHVDKASRCAA